MATLTIHLDDHLMHRAEAVSERSGKSLSELFTEYLAQFVTATRNSYRSSDSLPSRVATVETLRRAIAEAPTLDEDFARDLDSIRFQQPKLPTDPWQS